MENTTEIKSYEVKSYVDKRIAYSYYTKELIKSFSNENYIQWFDRYKDRGIITEIYDSSNNRKKLVGIKSSSLESTIDFIKEKVFKEPRKRIIKEGTPNPLMATYKKWTVQEDDTIMSLNPTLSHSAASVEEIAMTLVHRTEGAINERIKILRSKRDMNNIERLHEGHTEWTVDQENLLLKLISKEKYPLSYKVTSRLQEQYFTDKGYHNIRSKIRHLMGRP